MKKVFCSIDCVTSGAWNRIFLYTTKSLCFSAPAFSPVRSNFGFPVERYIERIFPVINPYEISLQKKKKLTMGVRRGQEQKMKLIKKTDKQNRSAYGSINAFHLLNFRSIHFRTVRASFELSLLIMNNLSISLQTCQKWQTSYSRGRWKNSQENCWLNTIKRETLEY